MADVTSTGRDRRRYTLTAGDRAWLEQVEREAAPSGYVRGRLHALAMSVWDETDRRRIEAVLARPQSQQVSAQPKTVSDQVLEAAERAFDRWEARQR